LLDFNTVSRNNLLAFLKSNQISCQPFSKENKLPLDIDNFFSASGPNKGSANEVLKPSTDTKKGELVIFPHIGGNTTEQIEQEIKKHSEAAYKHLMSMKGDIGKKISKEDYEKFVNFMQDVSNRFHGVEVRNLAIDMGLVGWKNPIASEPLLGVAWFLSYGVNKNFFKENIDEKLVHYKKFLITQRDLDVVYSFFGDSAIAQNEDGIKLVRNMYNWLVLADIPMHKEHFELIDDLVDGYISDMEENYTKTFKTPEQRTEAAFKYAKHVLPKIFIEIIRLEKLKPGSSHNIKGWICHFAKVKDVFKIEEHLELLKRYTEGLALQGETEIDGALESFNYHEITPTPKLIDNLLKLHRYSGVLRISRFIPRDVKDKQKYIEDLVQSCVDAFENKDYKKDSKIAVVFLPGVTEDSGGDVFSLNTGRIFKDLQEGGFKILPFEVDQDKQITNAVRRAYKVTGRRIDLMAFTGHGSETNGNVDGQSLNLGTTSKPSNFKPIDPKVLNEIRNNNQDYLRNIVANSPFPLWEVQNVATDKVTSDSAVLDVGDIDIMGAIKPFMNTDAKAVFYSCGSACATPGKLSVAKVFADNAGIKTYAASEKVNRVNLKIKNGSLINVEFLGPLFWQLDTREFVPGSR